MQPRTIEMDFEYQMTGILKQLLDEYEKTPADFESQDELDQFIWDHQRDLGRLTYEAMGTFTDDWLKQLEGI